MFTRHTPPSPFGTPQETPDTRFWLSTLDWWLAADSAHFFSDALSITNRYFTSLFSNRSYASLIF